MTSSLLHELSRLPPVSENREDSHFLSVSDCGHLCQPDTPPTERVDNFSNAIKANQNIAMATQPDAADAGIGGMDHDPSAFTQCVDNADQDCRITHSIEVLRTQCKAMCYDDQRRRDAMGAGDEVCAPPPPPPPPPPLNVESTCNAAEGCQWQEFADATDPDRIGPAGYCNCKTRCTGIEGCTWVDTITGDQCSSRPPGTEGLPCYDPSNVMTQEGVCVSDGGADPTRGPASRFFNVGARERTERITNCESRCDNKTESQLQNLCQRTQRKDCYTATSPARPSLERVKEQHEADTQPKKIIGMVVGVLVLVGAIVLLWKVTHTKKPKELLDDLDLTEIEV